MSMPTPLAKANGNCNHETGFMEKKGTAGAHRRRAPAFAHTRLTRRVAVFPRGPGRQIKRSGDEDARRPCPGARRQEAQRRGDAVRTPRRKGPTPARDRRDLFPPCGRRVRRRSARRASPRQSFEWERNPAVFLLASVPQISASGRGQRSSNRPSLSARTRPPASLWAPSSQHFGLRGRERDQRPVAAGVAAGGPVGLDEAAFERAHRQGRQNRAQRRDRRCGVAMLVRPGRRGSGRSRSASRSSKTRRLCSARTKKSRPATMRGAPTRNARVR